MKTALVTGAGGFLGSHLSEKLLREGWNVIAVDNFCTGLKSNRLFLESCSQSKNLLFFESDITDNWNFLDEVPAQWSSQLQLIFHFASPASPPHYQRLNLETIKANTVGLEKALQIATQYKARVIFASTSEIYGDPQVSPQSEDYWGFVNCYGERSCYDESKRLGETLIYNYNRRFQTQHGLVRIFNTYGPRMNPEDGRVVINFLLQAKNTGTLTMYGDGQQTRSFCYVDDLIDGIIRYAISNLTIPINIGNSNEFSIRELADIIQNRLFPDKKLQIQFLPLPKDDPQQRCPDLSKAYELLNGWSPKVSLEEGLQKMLASF